MGKKQCPRFEKATKNKIRYKSALIIASALLGGIMAYLHWSSDLDTGIEVIDKQHRRIVDYLNELNSAHDSGDLTATNHVLKELVDYTITHFAFEEELQERANYPFLKAHKRVHEIFAKRVAEFQKRAAAGENVAPELLSMLKIWLVNHIKGDDADYAECVKKALNLAETVDKTGGWLGGALKKFFG
jgi:hemerythrin